MKTSITKSSDKENVAKMSRPFDKLNTLYSKESWIRSSGARALDFLFKKIHQPIFFIKGYPHGLPLKWKKTPYVNFAVSFAGTQAAGVSHRKSRVNSLALQFSKLSFGARYEGLTVICRTKS